jgi:hypothetical protein
MFSVENMLRSAVKTLEVKTAYGPPIRVDYPFADGPPNPYLEKLQPQVKLTLANGQVVDMAPYGEPGPTKWPQIETYVKVSGAIIGAGAVLWVFAKLTK